MVDFTLDVPWVYHLHWIQLEAWIYFGTGGVVWTRSFRVPLEAKDDDGLQVAAEFYPGRRASERSVSFLVDLVEKNRGPWFAWWFNQLPGPSIFQKGHLCSERSVASNRRADCNLAFNEPQCSKPKCLAEEIVTHLLLSLEVFLAASAANQKGGIGPVNMSLAQALPSDVLVRIGDIHHADSGVIAPLCHCIDMQATGIANPILADA